MYNTKGIVDPAKVDINKVSAKRPRRLRQPLGEALYIRLGKQQGPENGRASRRAKPKPENRSLPTISYDKGQVVPSLFSSRGREKGA